MLKDFYIFLKIRHNTNLWKSYFPRTKCVFIFRVSAFTVAARVKKKKRFLNPRET